MPNISLSGNFILRTILLLLLGLSLCFCCRIFIYDLWLDLKFKIETGGSSVPIDVVLVSTEKDFEIVPYTVKSVRKFLRQPIAKIVLIAPKSDRALKLTHELNMEYIDENTLLNLQSFKSWLKNNKLSLNHPIEEWYYQQFLKLLYYKIAKSDYYYVIDSDIILMKPLVMVSDKNQVTYFVGHNMGQEISNLSMTKLMEANLSFPNFSYIADMMCFNKNIVQKLIGEIENKHNLPFYEAAILIEQGNKARFSEFELYGVYANSGQFNNNPIYLPRSGEMHHRSLLTQNMSQLSLKRFPYIAYHSWLKQK